VRFSVYDELISQATQNEADVVAARQVFEELTGSVRPDHELYNERSDAFIEWYLLERRGDDGRTPVERALLLATEPAPRATLCSLRSAQRSLYRVQALRPGGLILDDLYGGGRFDVDERRRLPGVQVADLLDARLLADPDEPYRLVLGRAVLFHPREAAPTVLRLVREAKDRREPRSAVLNRLLRLRLRALAYRHVSPARIYGELGERRPAGSATL
jgi:hypothetical protein